MKKAKRYNRPWRYALMMFGLSVAGYMYTTYGTYFYTEQVGLTMASIALANTIYAIWDAFNDPIAGYLSDRTRTRWGRRKPWLVVSVPVFIAASILFFSPPAALGTGVGLVVYFTFFLMLTETGNTISTVNYHSLLPELYRDEKQRNQANSLRQAMQLVGMIIGVSLVPMITSRIGYPNTALLLGLLSGALLLYSILGCKERSEFSSSRQPGLWASLKALAANRNFWMVAISHFFYQSTSALLLAGIPFYIKYTLELPDQNATFLSAAVFVSAIPSMYLWYRLINRIGTLKCWRIALAWLGLSLVPMYFIHSLLPACLCGVLVGIGIAGVTANLDMVNSTLIEDDARRNGVRREATFFAGISFISRLSSLTRSGVYMLVYVLFGFESGDNPGTMPGTAARFMMIVFPIALMALSFLFSLLVRLKTAGALAEAERAAEE
ncbi:MAG TPA: MFS transporter [Candidatus Fimivicinus intestinavium]|nr:MFS transporter [Candidatus Fimivicinus intestinavium]